MDDLIAAVASATAECGMQTQLPNWLPTDRHRDLRELIYDLTVGALTAYRDTRPDWEVPEPSVN
jgi:hypothetical protein